MANKNRIAVPPDALLPGARYVVRWLVDAHQQGDTALYEVAGMAAQFSGLSVEGRALHLLFATGKPGGGTQAVPWLRVIHLERA